MELEYKSWPVAILTAIDQLGNAIARGYPDATISARVGHFSENANHGKAYWQALEKIIDFAFYPVDGPGHCKQATLADIHKRYRHGSDIGRAILGVFIIIICPVIAVVLRILVFFYSPWRFE
jgi:hypothetical protein